MVLVSGQKHERGRRGIYRKGIWAFVESAHGARDIMTQAEYQASGILPDYDHLLTEEEFHVTMLGYRRGEEL